MKNLGFKTKLIGALLAILLSNTSAGAGTTNEEEKHYDKKAVTTSKTTDDQKGKQSETKAEITSEEENKKEKGIKGRLFKNNNNDKEIISSDGDIPLAPDFSFEDWIEPDDEEYYVFEISQKTPEKGISGGLLIYYGHFIKPPYKIEIRNQKVLINNIDIEEGPENLLKKQSERYNKRKRKFIKSYPIPRSIKEQTAKEFEFSENFAKFRKKIMPDFELYEANKDKIDKALKDYLSKHPFVKQYFYRTPFSLRVQFITGQWWATITGPSQPKMTKEERENYLNKQIEYVREIYTMNLKDDIKLILPGQQTYLSTKELDELVKILVSDIPPKLKIYKLYTQYRWSLRSAKFIYYNFNIKEYKSWRSINE